MVMLLVAAWLGAPPTGPAPVELLTDPSFQRGFTLLDPAPGKRVEVGRLTWRDEAGEPAWDLAQWSSRLSLAGARPERLPSGAVRYANAAKAILVGLPGSPEADLTLRVNGGFEYGETPRRRDQPWPHLLVSQALRDDAWLPHLTEVRFHLEARLLESTRHPMPGYTPNLHAAHYLCHVTVQNRNRQSPGHGDFYYFGIAVYDDRAPFPKPFYAPDGAGKYIHTPPGETFSDRSAHGGAWITLDRDLLPLLWEGLQAAWDKGFLKDSHDPADYRLASINLGWELPGTFDAELQVRHLSLAARYRAAP